MHPQEVCRIRKPAYAGNGCAIFPALEAARPEEKIRCSAEGDLIRGSIVSGTKNSGAHTNHRAAGSDRVGEVSGHAHG